MFAYYARWYVGAAWILLLLLTSLAADLMSASSGLLLPVGAIVPPVIMLALWRERPPRLHAAGDRS
jgi:hypothetical protein